MNTPRTALALTALALLGLTACSTPEPDAPTSEAPAAEQAPSGPSGDALVTAVEDELGADAQHVESIESPETGRVQITTNLTDPGTDSSAEQMQALAVCEAAARVEGVAYVNVAEADGTSWVLYGHPAVQEGECAVV